MNDKIRLAYVTSFREIFGDELVSREVVDQESRENYGYRVGNLEALAIDLNQGSSEFAQNFEFAMIFSDDTDVHFQASRQAVDRWPFDIRVPSNGSMGKVPLEELLVRIPSQPWRQIKDKTEKAEAKKKYEMELVANLHERRVDILISDSYLSLAGPVLLNAYGGRILNIHPAITEISSPYRLPGLTPTRDALTRAKHGFIIVDDKRKPETWPTGTEIEVDFEGGTRNAISVPRYTLTGVTVHVIDELVDHGPVVASQLNHISSNPTYESIRDRNYEIKRQLLPIALFNYAIRPEVQDMITEGRKAFAQPIIR